eukprot:2368113-Pyramimonas_sp.AAC.1
MAFWSQEYDAAIAIKHAFSCENAPRAQAFITRHHAPDHLFADIRYMGGHAAHDNIKDGPAPIPTVDFLVGGTECDNFSQLNFHSRANETGVLSSGSGTSGVTLQGLWDYIRDKKPKVVAWENSDKTKRADLTAFQNLLWRAGYINDYCTLDAKDYSLQSRPRIYLIAVFHSQVEAMARTPTGLTDQMKEDILGASWVPKVFTLAKDLAGHTFDIEQFLLPDDHDEVRNWRAHRMKNKAEVEKRAKGTEQFEFESHHLQRYSEAKIEWPPPAKVFADNGLEGCVDHLPRRNQEAVLYHTVKAARQLEEEQAKKGKDVQQGQKVQTDQEGTVTERVVDLNMKLDWQVNRQEVPCIVCTSRPWLVTRRRDVTGAEALGLQGYQILDLKNEDAMFTNPELLTLAGNAMSGFVLAVLLLAMFVYMRDTVDLSDLGLGCADFTGEFQNANASDDDMGGSALGDSEGESALGEGDESSSSLMELSDA